MRLAPLALLLLAPPLLAQQGPPPGCTAAEHRQFDFWVGSWSVTDSVGGTIYGSSEVTNEETGCLIHEHWSGSRGGTGQSFNYWDANKRQWEQDWVGSGGMILHLYGHLENGAIVMEADQPQGNLVAHHRAMWIPQPDGRVRQFWRQTTDGGKTWTLVFDGYYKRRG